MSQSLALGDCCCRGCFASCSVARDSVLTSYKCGIYIASWLLQIMGWCSGLSATDCASEFYFHMRYLICILICSLTTNGQWLQHWTVQSCSNKKSTSVEHRMCFQKQQEIRLRREIRPECGNQGASLKNCICLDIEIKYHGKIEGRKIHDHSFAL